MCTCNSIKMRENRKSGNKIVLISAHLAAASFVDQMRRRRAPNKNRRCRSAALQRRLRDACHRALQVSQSNPAMKPSSNTDRIEGLANGLLSVKLGKPCQLEAEAPATLRPVSPKAPVNNNDFLMNERYEQDNLTFDFDPLSLPVATGEDHAYGYFSFLNPVLNENQLLGKFLALPFATYSAPDETTDEEDESVLQSDSGHHSAHQGVG